MELYFQATRTRPGGAVIFTHTHPIIGGGGVACLKRRCWRRPRSVIAAQTFHEHDRSENLIAGPAMRGARNIIRAVLAKGPAREVDWDWQVDGGGSIALLRTTDLIMATGEDKRTIEDRIEFQMEQTPEAPAEMHFFIPHYQWLNLAENARIISQLLPFAGRRAREAGPVGNLSRRGVQMGAERRRRCRARPLAGRGVERIDTMISQPRRFYTFRARPDHSGLMNNWLTPPSCRDESGDGRASTAPGTRRLIRTISGICETIYRNISAAY